MVALCPNLSTNAQIIKGISASFSDETISIPFTRYVPIHPGGEIGFALQEKTTEKSIHQVNLYIGGFYHERVETALFLKAEYQYTFKIFNMIGFGFPIGLGYLHTFYPADVYIENHATGEFKTIHHYSRPHALISTGIGLSYVKFAAFQPFIKQELAIEAPFMDWFPSALAPHSLLKLGIIITLSNHEKK